MLFELLSDIIKIDDVLIITKNIGATCEIRSNSLSIRQKEKWITIGDNDGPAHMHVNSEMIDSAEFIQEQKPDKISFTPVKSVGTDCVHGDVDDFVQIDMNKL